MYYYAALKFTWNWSEDNSKIKADLFCVLKTLTVFSYLFLCEYSAFGIYCNNAFKKYK